MSFEELVRVVDRIGQTPHVDTFELKVGDIAVSLCRAAGVSAAGEAVAAPAADTARPTATTAVPAPEPPVALRAGSRCAPHPVTAPMVGFFQRAYASGGAPLVDVGTRVSADTQVGVIDAAKRMIPVFAGCDGVIAQVMVENGTPVAFGTPLMIVGAVADAASTHPSSL
jgi:acetyl-CoA carboxylase biotin carboxyl carrier protein